MRRIRRLVAAAAIGLAAGGVFLAAVSVYLAEGALHVPDHSRALLGYGQAFARGAGARAEQVSVRAEDGARLEGWLFTPARPNGAAAIVLHGVGDTRLGVLGQARFLLDAGYMVLTPDSRGHGASGGVMITYGLLEAGDIHQWANLLLARPGVERLYGAGQSMGAAILIESLAREPRFCALAADCPFATFQEVALDRVAQHGLGTQLLSWPVVESGLLYARLRYGIDLWRASPAEALRRSHTPVLLIHGTADTNIPIRHSRELHAMSPDATELWEVADAGHVASIGRDPAEYSRRVTGFFAAHRKVPKN